MRLACKDMGQHRYLQIFHFPLNNHSGNGTLISTLAVHGAIVPEERDTWKRSILLNEEQILSKATT